MAASKVVNMPPGQIIVAPTPTPLSILQSAVDKGMDADQLTRLMDLQERWERNRAAEAYAEAITNFQAQCPVVKKWRETETQEGSKFDGYHYASYDDVMREAGPLLAANKIAVTFRTERSEQSLKIICRVRVGIHYEDHEYTTPIPSMKVNDTQKFGAALKYAMRYCLCAALNIVTTDQDDDAVSMIQRIDDEQVAKINGLLEAKGRLLPNFLKWASKAAGVEILSLDAIPLAIYDKAVDILRKEPRKT